MKRLLISNTLSTQLFAFIGIIGAIYGFNTYGLTLSEETRKKIGNKKKGLSTWNKGKKFKMNLTEEQRNLWSKRASGSNNSSAKINEEIVREIIRKFIDWDHPDIGKRKQNGRNESKVWLFSKQYSDQYGITPQGIKRIITKKSWKHVWSELNL